MKITLLASVAALAFAGHHEPGALGRHPRQLLEMLPHLLVITTAEVLRFEGGGRGRREISCTPIQELA